MCAEVFLRKPLLPVAHLERPRAHRLPSPAGSLRSRTFIAYHCFAASHLLVDTPLQVQAMATLLRTPQRR